eukprot:CAMPEP_0204827570 /NCGR_PEP_ID=MMETSP1346-20131115/5007_1 /ASSEMBLY_ACC=CAM_ASM_000771 /TAXON_ID=215587 /ORGANISM="Aplanochytrium stocchinoi, Strain GSBS06" /LENGTH=492 /DNA_ID=CAMNT_0051956051 /DNA_START=229 /DNA_END=1706 /DNA_ORIENTATION=-
MLGDSQSLNAATTVVSFRGLSSSSTANKLSVDDPYTGEVFFETPLLSASEVRDLSAKSKSVQREWKTVPLEKRIQVCEGFIRYFKDNETQVATEISKQMGKPLAHAIGEIGGLEERTRALMDLAPKALEDIVLGESPSRTGVFERTIRREPVGTVMTLAPWNYPLLTAVNSVIPAVLAGNAVLLSHGPRAPLCSFQFEKAFEAAGYPGLVLPFHSDFETVQASMRQDIVDFVSFTGSVPTGRQVYETVGSKTFMDTTLELGGNDAGYVAADCDLKAAIDTMVDGSFFNAGQSCCGIERVFVDASVYDEFVSGARELISEYVLGNPMDSATSMGPMARPDAVAGLASLVADAREKGGKILIGGNATSDVNGLGRFFEPTLITECSSEMDVMQEETFGPILAVQKVDSVEEAIKGINDTHYGLTASIFTKDKSLAERMAGDLEVGTVFMNRADYLDPYLPWQGRKDTGKGLSLSQFGFQAFTNLKNLHFKLKTN